MPVGEPHRHADNQPSNRANQYDRLKQQVEEITADRLIRISRMTDDFIAGAISLF
jgi:hypothetical protein